MSSTIVLKCSEYEGVLTRKTDKQRFEKILISFDDSSLKCLVDIIDSNHIDSNNQNITIKELFIKRSDYENFMKDQTYEEKKENTINVKLTIARPNFEFDLIGEIGETSKFSFIITSIQLQLDTAKPIFAEDIVAFENIKATVFGNCFIRRGDQ